MLEPVDQAVRESAREAANLHHVRRQARAAEALEDVEDHFALAEAVEDIESAPMSSACVPSQTRCVAMRRQLGHDDAPVLRAFRRLDAAQLLDRQDIPRLLGGAAT